MNAVPAEAGTEAPPRRVLIVCDSFKGSLSASAAAAAIQSGWSAVRPADTMRIIPFADGGEGTIDALAYAVPRCRRVRVGSVSGPDGRPVDATYLMLRDRTAVVEFASSSGLPLMVRPDALGATSRGVGEVIAQALVDGARRVVVGLGGSASSDGGAGLLRALGLRVTDRDNWSVPPGATGLLQAVRLDASTMAPPPPDGVLALTDVDNPLLGPRGAAAVFGPQKGASARDVTVIEGALARWAELLGADAQAPGAGAAGGTAAGLAAVWGARLTSGSAWVAEQVGLDDAVRWADVVVTGEGRLDPTSFGGKAVGLVLAAAREHGRQAVVVAGSVDHDVAVAVPTVEVSRLAGSNSAAIANAAEWVTVAGSAAARSCPPAPRTPPPRPIAPSAHG